MVTIEEPEVRRAERGTRGVPDLRRLVEGALAGAFPHRVWVAGRVADPRTEPRVGLHFTLLADDDEPFRLPCLLSEEALAQVAEVLDRVHDADVHDLVAPDRPARVGGLLRYDFERGTLVLFVSELDPAPAARGLADERVLARERVREHGLHERQGSRACRGAPLSVSLVGEADDAAVGRARELLLGSPYAVDVQRFAVPLQGREAPAALAGAVREAGLRSDVVLLVRERGRPLTLGVFDAPEVSYAVSQAGVPVVCGLGGAGETTATDDVAHVALADGDGAARWVLDRLAEARGSLQALAAEVGGAADAAGERARSALADLRDDVRAVADEAQARAGVVRGRVRVRVLAVAALLALVLVAAAVVTGTPLVLTGLVVLAVLLLGARQWSTWRMTRGSRPMSQQDDEFTTVLSRLGEVRAELATTSSPEAVHRLRNAARQLVEHGEAILGRHLAAPAEAGSAQPQKPGDPAQSADGGLEDLAAG